MRLNDQHPATENAGVENAIRAELQGQKMQEWNKQE